MRPTDSVQRSAAVFPPAGDRAGAAIRGAVYGSLFAAPVWGLVVCAGYGVARWLG